MPQAQYMQALETANFNRLTRAALKRNLQKLNRTEGLRKVGLLMLDPPKWLEGMKLLDLLRGCHRMERISALKKLRRWAIPENKRVGQLTERQRHLIALELGAKELR